MTDGTEKFGRYFARKGWFGFSTTKSPSSPSFDTSDVPINTESDKSRDEQAEQRWHVSKASSHILVEVATAYAITKVFLPARVVASVWATPWFARVVVGRVGRYFGMRGVKKGTATASASGVVGKTKVNPGVVDKVSTITPGKRP